MAPSFTALDDTSGGNVVTVNDFSVQPVCVGATKSKQLSSSGDSDPDALRRAVGVDSVLGCGVCVSRAWDDSSGCLLYTSDAADE